MSVHEGQVMKCRPADEAFALHGLQDLVLLVTQLETVICLAGEATTYLREGVDDDAEDDIEACGTTEHFER